MEENKVMEEKAKNSKKGLEDRDFYQQACAYFYYHAEQRTTMINYFTAVFAASLALYGSLITKYPLASTFVSGFLFVVSLLFYFIDIRNRFDVKQSQNVICQIERDYKVNTPKKPDGKYAYGVFSNEENNFKYYGFKKRFSAENESYRNLRKLYKEKECMESEGYSKEEIEAARENYKEELLKFLESDKTISVHEIEESFESRPIITLSFSIRLLYYGCMVISLIAFYLSFKI